MLDLDLNINSTVDCLFMLDLDLDRNSTVDCLFMLDLDLDRNSTVDCLFMLDLDLAKKSTLFSSITPKIHFTPVAVVLYLFHIAKVTRRGIKKRFKQ